MDVLKRIRNADHEQEGETDHVPGLFGLGERRLFEHEVLQQVVIGIGKLDEDEHGSPTADEEEGVVPDPANSDAGEASRERAAVGRLLSMSLMAAVTASGTVPSLLTIIM